MFSGPLTEKKRPLWLSGRTGARRRGTSRSAVGNDGILVPAVPQSAHHIHELGCDLVAQVVLVVPLLLKFSAVALLVLVTTFQAARPPLRWSRDANARATWYGSPKLVDTVAPSPT
jgi:hypothetical protein